ncbi:beta-ketoacyl-ACP synthase II [Clostridium polynesiense]|uniref:beta-ketoacyl-ACP synthase II n=1 Tax=Clostridium polynesiense TaxID=1325933 RepID=UPI00058EE478|nr:beta-ketoacyl-ACP synthase II [Clostridium polynesiense]
MKNRVVISGMGLITPLGNTLDEFWMNLKAGKSGINEVTAVAPGKYGVYAAGEVKNFFPENYMERKEARKLDRFCQFAVAAAKEAFLDSGLNMEEENPFNIGVIVGSGIGGLITISEEHKKNEGREKMRVSPFFIPMIISNMASGNIAINLGVKGPSYSISSACATGTNSIGEAFRYIKEGKAEIMICGGAEAPITEISIAGFAALKALSNSSNVDKASLPFDKNRSGFVMGEGAGILILESLDHAIKRGAKIYAEITGYGSTCDAYHMTAPDPEGSGIVAAMEEAIEEAGIENSEINYINAHGTGTYYNDKIETLAIKKVFQSKAYEIPISSTKSMTGHLLGAAGAVEAIACIKALEEDFVHPTIGLTERDEECDLDYIPHIGRKHNVNYALSLSLGFGGHNAALIFNKYNRS